MSHRGLGRVWRTQGRGRCLPASEESFAAPLETSSVSERFPPWKSNAGMERLPQEKHDPQHQRRREPLFEHLLPLDPQIGDQLEAGIEVLDVGCGRGRALLAMAERFPHSRFTGLDLSGAAIDWARARARERGLGNIRFQQQDLTSFDLDAPSEAFDMITAFDAIHDQARPDRVLAGIRRALRPGGLFFMQDIGASSNVAENLDHPLGPLLYYLSCSHCMTVSLAAWQQGQNRRGRQSTVKTSACKFALTVA